MSFVALGGDGLRPTFFELLAAERLMSSLKAAVIYSLAVYAQRRPSVNRLLDNEDELFFLINALIDKNSFSTTDASFAEGIYGLKRTKYSSPTSQQQQHQGQTPTSGNRLSPKDQQLALILETLLPYLKSKLNAFYLRHDSPRAVQRQRMQSAVVDSDETMSQRLQRLALRSFMTIYPWAFAASEAARFSYQLLYLLGKSPYYSPELHILGQVVVRVTGQEVLQQERARQQQTVDRLTRIQHQGSHPIMQAMQRWTGKTAEFLSQNTRSGLILTVFMFKILEWWYTSAEQRLGENKALPAPPPPPVVKPDSKSGIPLPRDARKCPLCTRERTNPAMIASSGYVFCYPCVFKWVEAQGCCPVTRVPADIENIRRLYKSA